MKKLTLTLLTAGSFLWVNAQSISPDVVASAGNQSSIGSAELSWTIGEPVVDTYDNGSSILTQGFHQPQIVVTAIDEPDLGLEGISVFPNPSTYLLNIKLMDQQEKLIVSLYDASGRIVLTDHIVGGATLHQLDITGIANGSYMLKLLTRSGKQTAFNILKVQP